MSLLNVVRSAIKSVDTVTKPLQATVQHSQWTGQDGYGHNSFAAPVSRRAVVDLTRKVRVRMEDGVLLMTIAEITFLDPIPDNGASGRKEPVDNRDKIVLPDGSTGPIVSTGGPLDAGTNRPFLNTVLLGET